MSVFLNIPDSDVLYRDAYFFIIKDQYPVSPGHLLIISNVLKEDFFLLSEEEKSHLYKVIGIAKSLIESHHQPDGYNIGMNTGSAAGQTVFHFHCHVIPRYHGDTPDPSGGIRHCIPGKGHY